MPCGGLLHRFFCIYLLFSFFCRNFAVFFVPFHRGIIEGISNLCRTVFISHTHTISGQFGTKWTIWHNRQPSWQNINTQSGILPPRHRSCTTYSEHVQQREPARQTKHLLQQVTQQREMFNLGVDTLTRLHNRNSSTP